MLQVSAADPDVYAKRPGHTAGRPCRNSEPPGSRVAGDRIVAAMSGGLPVTDAPVTSVAGAITRMEAIATALPAADGLACFNRMYLMSPGRSTASSARAFSPIRRS